MWVYFCFLIKEKEEGPRVGGGGGGSGRATKPTSDRCWGEVRKESMILPPEILSLSEHSPFRELSEAAVGCVGPVTSNFCLSQATPLPRWCSHPASVLIPCVWFFWARNSKGQLALAKSTYFVPYKPVPHVPLNKSQRLSCLATTRAVCFFHMIWALCLYFKVSVFLPFFCVYSWRLKVCLHKRIVLMHSKECEFLFGRDIQKFSSGCWWGGQNQQNNNDSKYSSWGRNFCLYKLERDKIQETSQRSPITFQSVTASRSDSAL